MVKKGRISLGIIFNFSNKWLGGVYYIVNLINSLNRLPDEKKPEIYLFYNESLKQFLDDFEYDYLHKVKTTFPSYPVGYLQSLFKRKNVFVSSMIEEYDLQGIFPLNDHPVRASRKSHNNVKLVAWIADLQNKYYPGFFKKRIVILREIRIRLLLKNTNDLVVSSQSVADDFKKFYKLRDKLNLHIYHFSSIIKEYNFSNHKQLLEKYNLPSNYFMVSNQFHNHKNHQVVLEAAAKLKDEGSKIHIAITGKLPEKKDAPYILKLYDLLESHGLKENITFLGVIPRTDQLCLMRYCQAVIQPSLFEGWSTVIEDAISLQTPVIASNLDVNKEQLGDKGVYFDPLNAFQLAETLQLYPQRVDFDRKIYEDHASRVRKSAESFLKIFTN